MNARKQKYSKSHFSHCSLTTTMLRADDGPIAYWPLRMDLKDSGPSGLNAQSHGGELMFSQTDGVSLDGRDDWLEVPAHSALAFGTKDFTVSLWLHTAERLDDVPGDLLSQFDSTKRRGWNLSLKKFAISIAKRVLIKAKPFAPELKKKKY